MYCSGMFLLSDRIIRSATPSSMVLNRVLKIDITLLIILLGVIVTSSFLISSGNRKFIGILGIAVLACALLVWRIFILVRHNDSPSGPAEEVLVFNLERLRGKQPPRL